MNLFNYLESETARQEHGFKYENRINKMFRYTPYKALEKYDSEAKEKKAFWFFFSKEGTTRVSIKTCKSTGSIGLGDFMRISEQNEPFIMHVGFWLGTKSNIIEEFGVKISPAKWKSYMGNPSVVKDMKEGLKKISNSKKDDAKWKEFIKEYKEKYMTPGKLSSIISYVFNTEIEEPAIRIAPKRNHVEPGQLDSKGNPKKPQKRIQASMTVRDFINRVVPENEVFYHMKNGKILINKKKVKLPETPKDIIVSG